MEQLRNGEGEGGATTPAPALFSLLPPCLTPGPRMSGQPSVLQAWNGSWIQESGYYLARLSSGFLQSAQVMGVAKQMNTNEKGICFARKIKFIVSFQGKATGT